MWYFDEYMKNKDLTASLYYYDFENGFEGSNTKLLTGFLTTKYDFNISHEWGVKGTGNLVKDVNRMGRQFTNELYKMTAEQALNYASTLAGDYTGPTKTSVMSNQLISSNNNMFKAFNGTKIDIAKPELKVYLLTSKDTDNIFRELWYMTGSGGIYGTIDKLDVSNFIGSDEKEVITSKNMRFLGGFQAGKTYNIMLPPSKFRFTYNGNMDPNNYQAGTYKLITNKFLMTNLVLESMRVQFSDAVSAIQGHRLNGVENNISDTMRQVISTSDTASNYPLFAEITLNFDWCVTPTHATVIKLLMSTPTNEGNLGDAIYDQGINKI